jgi:hypothetical protein
LEFVLLATSWYSVHAWGCFAENVVDRDLYPFGKSRWSVLSHSISPGLSRNPEIWLRIWTLGYRALQPVAASVLKATMGFFENHDVNGGLVMTKP